MKVHRDLDIRPATAGDMPVLERVLGRERAAFYRYRLSRNGVVLTAWTGNGLAGTVHVSWEPADEAAVRRHLAGVPLVYRLHVPSPLRNQGLGSALLAGAERLARDRGHTRIASGVDPHDHRLVAWYRRLDYREWEHGLLDTVREVYQSDGTVTSVPDRCRIFVKNLG